MIIEQEPLSMAEALEYIKHDKDNESEVVGFINKFNKLKPQKAKELRKKIEGLDLIKLKSEHVVKIIDLMPENQADLNKIIEMGLEEDESKKILDAIKNFK